MVQKYYTSAEAATALGISEDEVKQMAQRQQLHGYRDGAQWKFKTEEVDRLVQERGSTPGDDEGEGDVLLSEFEVGPSASGTSGTVIGGVGEAPKGGPSDSDLGLGDDFEDSRLGPSNGPGSQFEHLDLSLDDELKPLDAGRSQPPGDDGLELVGSDVQSLDDDALGPVGTGGGPSFDDDELRLQDSSISLGDESGGGSSSINLEGKDLDDDDLVLGGSGAGSDITIGGDSGISLVDPADSGLSLEEPLDLSGGSDDSLELGEDDMIALRDDSAVGSPAELKTDDDFLLTPLEEAGDEDDSESGSQVIALDLEPDAAPTAVGTSALGSGVGAMLDEDLGPGIGSGVASGIGFEAVAEAPALGSAPLAAQPGVPFEGVRPVGASGAVSEVPYTGMNVAALSVCAVVLFLVGMMMFDLMRNMWSWDGAYSVNSAIMDFILNLI